MKHTYWDYEHGHTRIEGAYFPLPAHYPVPCTVEHAMLCNEFDDEVLAQWWPLVFD